MSKRQMSEEIVDKASILSLRKKNERFEYFLSPIIKRRMKRHLANYMLSYGVTICLILAVNYIGPSNKSWLLTSASFLFILFPIWFVVFPSLALKFRLKWMGYDSISWDFLRLATHIFGYRVFFMRLPHASTIESTTARFTEDITIFVRLVRKLNRY